MAIRRCVLAGTLPWVVMSVLLAAILPTAHGQAITVGPNVAISPLGDGFSYAEVRIAADPGNANRLIACGMREFGRDAGAAVYVSSDRGSSWHATLVLGDEASDPECEFGNHGDAYFVVSDYADIADLTTNRTRIYWSGDGGQRWHLRPLVPFIDREQMAVDRTDGDGRDMLYILGMKPYFSISRSPTGEVKPSLSSTIYRSSNEGRFFDVTALVHDDAKATGPTLSTFHTHPVVLSDGSVVFLVQQAGSLFSVYVSGNHGVTFSRESAIPDPLSAFSAGGFAPELAVARDGIFKDRLYAVYCGKPLDGVQQAYLIHSQTRGKTWSVPLAIGPSMGPYCLPEVAVNRFGVVGISWYASDHRFDVGIGSNPKYDPKRDMDVRFAASLDGGQTVLPSVIINRTHDQKPIKIVPVFGIQDPYLDEPRFLLSIQGAKPFGETAGIVADAQGSFHPDWIDFRGGLGQIWTTRIEVSGTVAKTTICETETALPSESGETSRASEAPESPGTSVPQAPESPRTVRNDVTAARCKAHVLKFKYDRKRDLVEADIQLEGKLTDLQNGVYFQADDDSSANDATLMNTDNGMNGTGGRWLFKARAPESTSADSNHAFSQVRHLAIHVPKDDLAGSSKSVLIYFRVVPSTPSSQ